jgi:hypothetical protein
MFPENFMVKSYVIDFSAYIRFCTQKINLNIVLTSRLNDGSLTPPLFVYDCRDSVIRPLFFNNVFASGRQFAERLRQVIPRTHSADAPLPKVVALITSIINCC